jgi:1,4-alpha-glucan branching enzyme
VFTSAHQKMTVTSSFDPQSVLKLDGYLEPFIPAIAHRNERFRKWKDDIDQYEGGYENFTKGFEKMGFNVKENGEVVYREWAPNATEAHLIGDFSEYHLHSGLGLLKHLLWIQTTGID